MKVYHISRKDLGDSIVLIPRIPTHRAHGENSTIPRICCTPSIYNCLIAMEATADLNDKDITNLYVYCADVDPLIICQPELDEVPDAFYTNELWILQQQRFYKECNATLKIHMNIPSSPYSRYMFTRDGCEDVLDRITSMPVYGTLGSFSYIDLNADRIPQAIQYAEQHREEYEC